MFLGLTNVQVARLLAIAITTIIAVLAVFGVDVTIVSAF